MEQLIFILSSFGIVAVVVFFGFAFLKIEKGYQNTNLFATKNFDAFLKRIKGNSSKIRY